VSDATRVAGQTVDPVIREDVVASLRVAYRKPRLRLRYRIGAAAVALLILLLPAVYFAVTACAAALLVWHLKANTFFNPDGQHPSFFGFQLEGVQSWFVYEALILPWILVTVFLLLLLCCLVVPLVARRRVVERACDVSRKDEPFLHEYVATLCRTIGAPRPRAIRVDCRANASAGFHEGTAGMLGGRRVLTIGLPLALDLSLAELTGVLAHELGHFSQGFGTRLTFMIGAVNGWLARLRIQQIAWDNRLGQVRPKTLLYLAVPVVRRLVRLVRWVFDRLLRLSARMTAAFLRQLELNADAFQAALVGGDRLASALRRIARLERGAQVADSRMMRFWGEHRLVDDIPALVVAETGRLPQSGPDDDDGHPGLQAVEPWLATHPPNEERVRAATAIHGGAEFRSDLPASALFDDLATRCRTATWQLYSSLGAKRIKREHLVSVREFLGSVDADLGQTESVNRYFQGLATIAFPVPVLDFRQLGALDPDSVRAEITALRNTVVSLREEGRRAFRGAVSAIGGVDRAQQAEALLRAGFKIKAQEFKLSEPTLEGCRKANADAVAQVELHRGSMSGVLHALGRRLQLGLACAASFGSEAAAQAGKERLLGECEQLLATARLLGELMPRYLAAAASVGSLNVLLVNSGKGGMVPRFEDLVQGMVGRIWKSIDEIREGAGSLSYPFEAAGGPMTLSRHLVPLLRGSKDLATTMEAYRVLETRIPIVYFRVLGRLAEIAEGAEWDLGFEPLPEPTASTKTAAP
jgi:Zn-dependent protease with chaperone function